ncbi:MAG TPA: HAD family phosphatase [Blastocatellia bacterium]|nr:HAD family phosphatase [Blastocatellia bacterium]
MLRAIIFDCDGVIADTEPIHMAAFQKALLEEGIEISEEEYYSRYLAYDDRGCFTKVFADRNRQLDEQRLVELVRRKAQYVGPAMRTHMRIFPGVADFIGRAAASYPLAIASGALRHEIEMVLECGGVRHYFDAVISAEDVERSKPHPDPFLKALSAIAASRREEIAAAECLVIEDSVHGVRAARLAGMVCLAVTNSYDEAQLAEADRVVSSLEGLTLKEVEELFRQGHSVLKSEWE